MKKLIAICLISIVSIANASWQQLPEAQGWNVGFDYLVDQRPIADNWLAATTAAVTDIRLWGSWYNDEVSTISLHVAIHADVPYDEFTEPISRPGTILWQKDVSLAEQTDYGQMDDGFFVPFASFPLSIQHDSHDIYQITISDITDFTQEAGKVYWLSISAWYYPGVDPEHFHPGWVTSANHSLPGAAYVYGGWLPLVYPDSPPPGSDPRHGQPIDLAFEIVPEPATICMLGIGALSLIRRKK